MASEKKVQFADNGSAVTPVNIRVLMGYCTAVDLFYLMTALLCALLSGFGWPAFTVINGQVIDTFLGYEQSLKQNDTHPVELMSKVYLLSGLQMADSILYGVAIFGTLYCLQMFAHRVVNSTIKRAYFEGILRQEIVWFDQTQSQGKFAEQITSDFKKIQNGVNENLGLLVSNCAGAVLQLATGLYFGWQLSLLVLCLLPVIWLCTALAARFQRRYCAAQAEANEKANTVAEEAIYAIRTVVAFAGEPKERQRYTNALTQVMISGSKLSLVSALDNAVKWCTQYASLALALWYGVTLVLDQPQLGYTIGRVVIVFWCSTSFGYNLAAITPYWESIKTAKSSATGILQIAKRPSAIDPLSKRGKMLSGKYQTGIEFRDVHFHYAKRPEAEVLSGLDLKINSGEILALVGSSGCGKSTILQLMQRFYDPNSGEILLDGVNIKELNIGWLRQQMGVVGQEPVLFECSIAENIRMGLPLKQMDSLTHEDIVRAAMQANAHEFIQNLPDGYATNVGDRGTQLSGGQKQRIAIARALIGKPRILLLDEATSALDLQNEQLVQIALDRASQGRTTIIVAHRLSTIKKADRIVVLDAGKVLEAGTHQELMQHMGGYYDLVNAQHQQVTISQLDQDRKNDLKDRCLAVEPTIHKTSQDNDFQAKCEFKENADFGKKNSTPHLRLLSLIWRLGPVQLVLAFSAAILYGLATPTYAVLFGSLVDTFSRSNDSTYLWEKTTRLIILFASLSVAIFICHVLQISLFGRTSARLTMTLRVQAFESILGRNIAWFDLPQNSSGALCSRLVNDAADIQGLTGLRIAMLAQAASTLLASVGIGFFFSWRLALLALVLMPLVGVTTALFASQLYSGQVALDGEIAQQSGKILLEVSSAIRTVTSLHKQEYFLAKFNAALDRHYRASRSYVWAKAAIIAISQAIPFAAYALCYGFGGFLLSRHYLSTGDLFRITESMVFGALVVGRTAVFSSDYTRARMAALNIFKLIDDGEMKVRPIASPTATTTCQGNVAFCGVHFHYPNRPDSSVLRGLSFEAKAGETVALVGPSGSGKSTVIQLLEQFYECTNGKIELDGQDIAKLNTEWIRSQMGLVAQEPNLFSYSIAENIAYGDNSRVVPLEEIVRAAQIANVHQFVQSLPQGYDTPVGAKGIQLSVGQKQRIAIARALVRSPAILLLDEATSALDTCSEKTVQEALAAASIGRTCIVIAHRPGTIEKADKIVPIHGRQIEEQ